MGGWGAEVWSGRASSTRALVPLSGTAPTHPHTRADGGQLAGPIPTELVTCFPLIDEIDLSYNNVSGTGASACIVPSRACARRPPSPTHPHLPPFNTHTHTRHAVPAFLGNLTKLDELKLEHNQLTGTIPSALGNMAGEWAWVGGGLGGWVGGWLELPPPPRLHRPHPPTHACPWQSSSGCGLRTTACAGACRPSWRASPPCSCSSPWTATTLRVGGVGGKVCMSECPSLHSCTPPPHPTPSPTHTHRQPLRAGQLEPGERGHRWECQAVWHGAPGREAGPLLQLLWHGWVGVGG